MIFDPLVAIFSKSKRRIFHIMWEENLNLFQKFVPFHYHHHLQECLQLNVYIFQHYLYPTHQQINCMYTWHFILNPTLKPHSWQLLEVSMVVTMTQEKKASIKVGSSPGIRIKETASNWTTLSSNCSNQGLWATTSDPFYIHEKIKP